MNLGQHQIHSMRQHADIPALIDATTNKTYTYRDVIDRIQRLAAGLKDLGLRQGDVVCHLAFNHIDFPILVYAVNLLGAALQTASPDYTDDELERRFQECSTKYLFTTPDQAKRISKMLHLKKLKSFSISKPNIISKIITFTETVGYTSFDSLFTTARVTEATTVDPNTSPAFLLSSSGTTGLPKHVILTHTNIITALPLYKEVYGHTPGMRALICLPMFHHYGILSSLTVGLNSGTTIVVMQKYVFKDFLQYIENYKPNILYLVPPIAARLVKDSNTRNYDLTSVTYIKSAAAPLGIELETQLLNLFPNTTFIAQVYGLTETGVTSGNSSTAYKPGSNGKVPKGLSVKITDPETGTTLGPNKTGEITVKGPQITIGYLNNKEATRNAFDKDGYFKTGDLGYFDDEGFLFIVDRLKELIKYKGLQVAPAYLEDLLMKHPDVADAAVVGIRYDDAGEQQRAYVAPAYLEDLLMKHPDVADAAVVGIRDDDAGELPKAFVVKQPGSKVTEMIIIQYIADHVANHERLRGGVEFIEHIPKSASGKILRRLLRDRKPKSKL